MPNGILGQAALGSAVNATVYTVPALKEASCSINLCNTTLDNIKVRLALAAADAPVAAEYIEYDAIVPPGGVLERTGIVLQAAKKVVGYASAAGISMSVFGYEE